CLHTFVKRKRFDNQYEKFVGRVYEIVEKNVDFSRVTALVIAGTFTERAALAKSLIDLANKRRNSTLIEGFKRIVQAAATNGILLAVRDVLSDSNMATVLEQCKSYKDMELVSQFNESMMRSEHTVAIGYNDILKTFEADAIKELLLTDEMTRICGVDKRMQVCRIIEGLKRKGIVVHMLSGKTEAGCEIMRLGGIVAILRYELVIDEDDGEFAEDYNSDEIDWFGKNVPQAIGDYIEVDE
ncbi:pelota protein, putative, partial [Entamoeba invadens IP1]|uniref:pelota protein, putative n=1 Tax=Entamoeba invadens IP1 TaxID=370355 RepID=UPI0002C3D930